MYLIRGLSWSLAIRAIHSPLIYFICNTVGLLLRKPFHFLTCYAMKINLVTKMVHLWFKIFPPSYEELTHFAVPTLYNWDSKVKLLPRTVCSFLLEGAFYSQYLPSPGGDSQVIITSIKLLLPTLTPTQVRSFKIMFYSPRLPK